MYDPVFSNRYFSKLSTTVLLDQIGRQIYENKKDILVNRMHRRMSDWFHLFFHIR